MDIANDWKNEKIQKCTFWPFANHKEYDDIKSETQFLPPFLKEEGD